MTDLESFVEVRFGETSDATTVHAAVSALADMAMSNDGATIADLDVSEAAIGELLDVLLDSRRVVSALIDTRAARLVIECDGPLPPIAAESRELIDLGLGDIEIDSNRVRASLSAARSDS